LNVLKLEFNEYTNNTRLKKDNVGLFVELKSTSTNHVVVFGTTHLYYKSSDARNQQADCFLKYGLEFASKNPVVVCGDFNCMPSNETIKKFYDIGLECGFESLIQNTQPKYSTFLGGKNSAKWYDFIFHSTDLIVSQVLSVPHQGQTLLPNSQFSSDHVALVEDIYIA